MTKLTGRTRVLGIIGHPVAQARAPELWTALFERQGIDRICVPFDVHPDGLSRFLNGAKEMRNVDGFLVTIPHKRALDSLVERRTRRALDAGSINVLRLSDGQHWEGDTVDGAGFVAALDAGGHLLRDRNALIVGTGGVATSIAFALAAAGVLELALASSSTERAADLADRVTTATGVKTRVSPATSDGFDLVINASPIGMRDDDPMPVDVDGLAADAVAADVVIRPGLTRFLAAARERGCATQSGEDMMDHQIAAIAEYLSFGPGDWGVEAIASLL